MWHFSGVWASSHHPEALFLGPAAPIGQPRADMGALSRALWGGGTWGVRSPVSNLQDAVPEMPLGVWGGQALHLPHVQVVAGGQA